MYDTQYNRKIAKEMDAINKNYAKHNKELEGGSLPLYLASALMQNLLGNGHPKGQQEYSKKGSKKQVCSYCAGSGISGSGVSGSGMSGSGGFGLNLPFGGFDVGWGKPAEHKKLKGKGGFGLNLPFGGFNVGWGKPEPKAKKTTVQPTEEVVKKKRGNPNLSKRADIVKKVMKEQGLSMIKASQYVKAHNLY